MSERTSGLFEHLRSLRFRGRSLLSRLLTRGLRGRLRAGRQAQRALVRANRLYAALSATNKAIVHSKDRDELFGQVCRAAVEHGGLSLAYVCLIDNSTGTLVPVASSGPAHDFVRHLDVSLSPDTPSGKSPI